MHIVVADAYLKENSTVDTENMMSLLKYIFMCNRHDIIPLSIFWRDDGYSDSGVPVAWSLLNSKGTVISGTTTYSSSVREGQSFEITISVSGISLNQSYTLTAKSPSGY